MNPALTILAILASAHARPAPSRSRLAGTARIELANGQVATAHFAPSALTIESVEVTDASCRSCVGDHTTYALYVTFPRGPIEWVHIDADVVGGRSEFQISRGPYPARSEVRIRMRGAGQDVALSGRLSFETTRAPLATHVTYTGPATGPGPVRSMRFDVVRTQ